MVMRYCITLVDANTPQRTREPLGSCAATVEPPVSLHPLYLFAYASVLLGF